MNKKIINNIIDLTQKEIQQHISNDDFIIGIPALLYLYPISAGITGLNRYLNDELSATVSINPRFDYQDLLLFEQIIDKSYHDGNQIVSLLPTEKNYEIFYNCSLRFSTPSKTRIFNLFRDIEINDKTIKFVFSDIFKTLLVINKMAPKVDLNNFNDEMNAGLVLRHLIALRENNIKKININDVKKTLEIELEGIEHAALVSKVCSSDILKQLNIKFKDDFFIFGSYLSENQKTSNIKSVSKHKNKDKTLDFNLEFLKIATGKGYNMEEASTQFKNFKNHYYNNGVIKKDWLLAYDIWLDNHKKNNAKNCSDCSEDFKSLYKIISYGKAIQKDSLEFNLTSEVISKLDGYCLKEYYLFLNKDEKYFSANGFLKRNKLFESINDFIGSKAQEKWNSLNFSEVFESIKSNLYLIFGEMTKKYSEDEKVRYLNVDFLKEVRIEQKPVFESVHLELLGFFDLEQLFSIYKNYEHEYFGNHIKYEMMRFIKQDKSA
ncbi:hypothetical protein [Aquamicrobium sp.]|uniref:hypothetical protein n=1 Tax=Aquamicrobium sp. TaxID=1872579 RepID=UPI002583AF77|nr:hypothetical protein [Aquamicrobium sp.]MCK9549310.1 hypothetical protein [Aquamicrobium sp.]